MNTTCLRCRGLTACMCPPPIWSYPISPPRALDMPEVRPRVWPGCSGVFTVQHEGEGSELDMTRDYLYERDGTYNPRMVKKILKAMKAKPAASFDTAEDYWKWLNQTTDEPQKEKTPCE